jgi:hypothetical protein
MNVSLVGESIRFRAKNSQGKASQGKASQGKASQGKD